MRAWVRRSFRNRIFVTMLLAAVLPMLLCGALMMRLQIVRSEKHLSDAAQGQLADLREVLDGLQSVCGETMEELAGSTVVRSALRRGGGESRTLYQVLFQAAQPLEEYVRFDIYDRDGCCRYTSASALPAADMDPEWGVLRAAREEGGMILRSGPEGGLIAARAVRDYSGEALGYVTATVEQSGFDRLFAGRYPAASEVLLLDGRWRPVYYSRPAQTAAAAELLRGQLLRGEPLSGGDYRFFAVGHEGTGSTLILQQPRAFSDPVLGAISLTGALMGALCLALSLLSAWILSRYLSEPVQQLDQAMGEIERGRLDVRLETDRSDELGRLGGRFNRMAEEYRLNLDRSVQRQKELNDTRIRMMQAQLDPHFLYNTLDTVKWLGVGHQVPQVAQLATDLAVLLRSSISGEEIVPLERELELVERYVDIQSVRFEDRFVCEIDVPERYQSCRVPKLCLQPLVENAIVHGAVDREEGYVKLWAGEEDGDLLLYVSDNGPGLSAEVLERLNSEDKRLPGGRLGLYNVDSIIRLHYGKGYGLSARNQEEEGSCVWLRLPIQREGEKENAESPDR
ncbi:MAG: sensor histidine kinase [Oscillospiraceae bacterium]|nr:sensor histidine kinase [Oscillospiraceae bacterium]